MKITQETIDEDIRQAFLEEIKRRKIEAFKNRGRFALLGDRYVDADFSTTLITENNRKAYEICKNYAANAQTVIEKNIGLYIWGDNSTGKTHLTACLCNELVANGYRCVYTNIAKLLEETRNWEEPSDLVYKLKAYDFTFIDDLGKEFISREYNPASCKWAEQQLFEILNARYNSKKPTVFSSNYAISELATVIRLDKGIVERVNEMATRVIKMQGDDFRQLLREEKSREAKELGI